MFDDIEDAEVSIAAEEKKKVADAVEALRKDSHAPREVSIRVTLHIHNEYPKHLYKGEKSVLVNNEDEEYKAVEDGYGPFVPAVAEEK